MILSENQLMLFMFYLEKRKIVACNMLARLVVDFLKTRFSEHYLRTKKPRKIDNFLYRHFKQTNHSTSSISIQPVEKII